jgi:hypothetical protein
VRENKLLDIEQFSFEALMKRSKLTFSLGDSLDPRYHFHISRTIEIPAEIFDESITPVFINLYNHSQAGKTTALNAIWEQNSSRPTFHVVLCRFSGSNLFQDLYVSLSLAEKGIGGLETYVADAEKHVLTLRDLFAKDLFGTKRVVLMCDNLDSLVQVQGASLFFDFLKSIREEKSASNCPFFKAFVGVGVYRSDMVPSKARSGFKFQPNEIIRFETYFDFNELTLLGNQLEQETGIHIKPEICQEIFNSTGGHPGYVSFFLYCVWRFLKERAEQLDLCLWRRIVSGRCFHRWQAETDLGKKIDDALKDPRNKDQFETVLKRLLISGVEYIYENLQSAEKEAIDRLVDFGMIQIDKGRILFSCDIVWAQTMNRFCDGVSVQGPSFTPEQLESTPMLDFLKATIPFIDSSGIHVLLSSKLSRGNQVPSEYYYQFELNKIFSHAGNGYFRTFNESNHNLGARRADIRIVNSTDWAVIELMSHATEIQFVEHIRRTFEVYSVLNTKHLAVIQFHTDWDYKLTATVQAEIERTQGSIEIFVVIHDPAFTKLKIRDISRQIETDVIQVRSIIAGERLKRKAVRSDAEPSSKVIKIDESGNFFLIAVSVCRYWLLITS